MDSEGYDLSLVAPQARAETMRRLEAIEAFLGCPGRKEAERHATDLGVHVTRFYGLVRTWRDGHNIIDLVPNMRPHKRRSSLSAEQQSFIDRVVLANPDLPVARMADLVTLQAKQSRMELPTPGVVRRYIMKCTRGRLPAAVQANYDLLVDHVVLDIPVGFSDGSVKLPLCSVIIDVAANSIAGLHLSTLIPSARATAAALQDALTRSADLVGNETPHPRLGLNVTPDDSSIELTSVLESVGFKVVSSPATRQAYGASLRSLFGDRWQGIRLRPMKVWRPQDRNVERPTRVTSVAEATSFVAARFNVSESPLLCGLPRAVRDILASRLTEN